ncbi:MAG: CDP-diacylglycerol--serine O-phosphatidyltransferase [Nitrospirota bacterium]
MRKGIYILPNTLTLCGMFLGFYSILAILKGNYIHAAWAVVLAIIFDGLDGWVARLTHSTTKFGIELDSLSDLVAFGIAPAVMVYKWALMPFGRVGWSVAFLFVACGALRLARYNVQMGSTESKSFTGMPIPAAAIILATFVIFYHKVWETTPAKNYLILIFTFILAVLMVSTLRFHGAKEIDFRRRKPFWILVAIVIVFVFIIIEPSITLFIFAMIYLIGGIIENMVIYYRKRKQVKKTGITA